jgi:hypothetical protein
MYKTNNGTDLEFLNNFFKTIKLNNLFFYSIMDKVQHKKMETDFTFKESLLFSKLKFKHYIKNKNKQKN